MDKTDSDSKTTESKLGEAMKRLFAVGLSAAFMTEESIRSYLGDLNLPKEALQMLLKTAANSKEQITSKVSKEVVRLLSRIDLVKEASKFLEEHKFKVNAEIEIIRKER